MSNTNEREFERKQKSTKTDGQIRELAGANLSEWEQANRRQIDNAREEAERLLSSNREAEQRRGEEQLREIESAFAQAQQRADNDALRRGLARSSIAVNRTADIQTASAEAESNARGENSVRLADIDAQLARLDSQREQALNDFNIAHAARITQEINRLTGERTAQNDAAIQFNNNVLNQEMQRELNAVQLAQRTDDLNASRASAERARHQEALFTSTFRELEAMSARDARNEIRNNVLLREQLTPSQFFRLYDRFGR
ncbi:MAG: hypothetical protein FWC80_01930 [Firmicutes bacterium]|nr:hypothetical protein [Bacillota bacterium]